MTFRGYSKVIRCAPKLTIITYRNNRTQKRKIPILANCKRFKSAENYVTGHGSCDHDASSSRDAQPTFQRHGADVHTGEVQHGHYRGNLLHEGFNRSSRSYYKRRKAEEDKWINIAPLLRDVYTESLTPQSEKCGICGDQPQNIIKCADCGHNAYFCIPCVQKHHEVTMFHKPSIWQGKLFVPYMLNCTMKKPHHDNCPTALSTDINVIDDKGREHVYETSFCSCEPRAATLVRYGLWPSSPAQPHGAIHRHLMELQTNLLLDGHLALKAFCTAIGTMYKDTLLTNTVDLYHAMTSHTTSQYRNHRYMLRYPVHLCNDYPDGTLCPICSYPKTHSSQNTILPSTPMAISLDGTFRLVRKRSAGESVHPPFHSNHFFLSNSEVQKYIHNQPELPVNDLKDCSDFKAGDKVRSKVNTQKLDVTGVFGSVCHHEHPIYFLDMTTGERYGYAVSILDKVIKELPQDRNMNVFYDIACRLLPYLKRSNYVDILSKINLAVPVFHGFAHKSPCQVLYSPRWKEGFGLVDGEGVERVWSYLNDFTSISKEMTPSHRIDLLVEGLLNLTRKLWYGLGSYLVKKIDKAKIIQGATEMELSQAWKDLSSSGYSVNENVVRSWKNAEQEKYKAKVKNMKTTPWQEKYASLLVKFYNTQDQHGNEDIALSQTVELLEDQDRTEKELKRLEQQTKVIKRWDGDSNILNKFKEQVKKSRSAELIHALHKQAIERRVLINLKKTYARGNDSATQLSKQIKKVNEKMMRLIKQRNFITDEKLTFESSKDPDSALYHEIPENIHVPYHLHRKAVDSLCLRDRCKEEISSTFPDIKKLLAWHENTLSLLYKSIEKQNDSGCIALLIHHAILHEKLYCQTVNDISVVIHDYIPISLMYSNISDVHKEKEFENCNSHDIQNDLNLSDDDLNLSDDDLPSDNECE